MENIIVKNSSHHHQSLNLQHIIFQNNPNHNQTHTVSNSNPSSNHQINYKINRTLKKTFLNNKIFNSNNHHLLTDSNSTNEPRSIQEKQKLQIFALPGSIANLSRLNPNRKNTNQSFSHRKLFPQEEDFLNQLKQKTKIKSSRNFSKSFINDISKNKFTNLQKLSTKKITQNKDIEIINISSQRGNRSKTLDVQNTNESNNQSNHPFKRQKNYLLFKKNYQKQLSENMNKFYQKFQNFCKKEHNQKLSNFNQLKPIYHNSSQKRSQLSKKPSFRQKIEQRMTKLNQKKSQKRNKDKLSQKIEKIQHINANQIERQEQDQLISQAKSQIKKFVKSNSNSKVFDRQNKKSKVKKAQNSNQKQFHNQETSENTGNKQHEVKSGKQKELFFSWKGQRIHQSDKIQDSTSYLLKSQSNINKKKTKYFHHQKNMKINNNMHIVLTENNKTKINIFHNSMLLKEDPQKVDALASLVREATQGVKPQKISIPFELEINRLNIVQKSSPTSVKNSKKKVNEHIKQMVKNLKSSRKSPIHKMKTQRRYNFRMQDVQPWEINDKRSIQDSKQLFNSSFYCNSKTIV